MAGMAACASASASKSPALGTVSHYRTLIWLNAPENRLRFKPVAGSAVAVVIALLAVATFSLSILMAAFSSAAVGASPKAIRWTRSAGGPAAARLIEKMPIRACIGFCPPLSLALAEAEC